MKIGRRKLLILSSSLFLASITIGCSVNNSNNAGNKILNQEGLRNDKEFVNHKILDCIGDLYTSGYRIVGSIVCSQGGHYLTNQLLRKVFQDKNNFTILKLLGVVTSFIGAVYIIFDGDDMTISEIIKYQPHLYNNFYKNRN